MKTSTSNYFMRFETIKCSLYKLFIITILYSLPGLTFSQNKAGNNDFKDPQVKASSDTYQAYRFIVNGAGQLDATNSTHLRLLTGNQLHFQFTGSPDAIFSVPETYIVGGNLYPRTLLFNSRADYFRIVADKELGLSAGGVGKTSGVAPHMTIKADGKVGIGTTFPNEKLELYNGNFRATYSLSGSTTGIFNIKPNSSNDRVWVGTTSTHNLTLAAGNKEVIDLNKDGYAVIFRNGEYPANLNISVANRAKYSLFVLGGVLSEDYSIGPRATWADHVFDKEYNLMDLKEVENYINTNNRLPDIPSASEVQSDGYSLHDMNVKLLQKVEELTLYSIEQNKRIEQLEKKINQSKLNNLEE